MNSILEQAEFERRDAPLRPDGSVAARFQGINKEYRLDSVIVKALSNVTCMIEKGVTTFVTGPSGSGKSTFLNVLGLIDRPTSGQMFLFGKNVTDLTDAQAADFRSRHIGFIFQSFNLIPVLSVRENVEFPLLRHKMPAAERRAKAETYLKAVGLGEYMDRRPGKISGGQRQRVAIARALVTEPDLIVADEPTANLDSKTSREIIALLDRMKSEFDTSVVICTHETDLITPNSTVIEIIDGQLASGAA